MTDNQTSTGSTRTYLWLGAILLLLLTAIYFFLAQDEETVITETPPSTDVQISENRDDTASSDDGMEASSDAIEGGLDQTIVDSNESLKDNPNQPVNMPSSGSVEQSQKGNLSSPPSAEGLGDGEKLDDAELLATVNEILKEFDSGALTKMAEPPSGQNSTPKASANNPSLEEAERLLQEVTAPPRDGGVAQPLFETEKEDIAAKTQEIESQIPPSRKVIEQGEEKTNGVRDGDLQVVAPEFDTVRIDTYGTTLIAGRAEPNTSIQAIVNGEVAHQGDVSRLGQFTMIFDIDTENVAALEVTLNTVTIDGQAIPSEQTIVVLPSDLQSIGTNTADSDEMVEPSALDVSAEGIKPLQPTVLLSSLDGVRVIQHALPKLDQQTLVEMITYDETGEAILGGQARNLENTIRIYIDNQFIKDVAIQADKSWSSNLAEIEPGRYMLRVDEVNRSGRVVGRVEMPLQKEGEDFVKAMLAATNDSNVGDDTGVDVQPFMQLITVQRGYTLWGISRNQFGLGRLYVNIFDLNKDQIRDPDLIYPGQIFQIPQSDDLFDPEYNRRYIPPSSEG